MSSKKILEAKQAVVDELSEKLKNAVAGVIVNYQGITVEKDTEMRAKLRAAGIDYSVKKNSLIGRACDNSDLSGLKQYLEGMSAIAVSREDPVAAAKILKEYADNVETFEIKAGFVDGDILDKDGVMALAEIPSKEGLIAKLLGSIQSPLYNLTYGLQAIIDKGGEAVPAAAEEAAPASEEAAPAAEEAAPAAEEAAPAAE